MKQKYWFLLIGFFLIVFESNAQISIKWQPDNKFYYGDKMFVETTDNKIRVQFNNADGLPLEPKPEVLIYNLWYEADSFYYDFQNIAHFADLFNPIFRVHDDTNFIVVKYFNPDNILDFDTNIYRYSKPNLSCNSVNNEPYSKNMVLFNPEIDNIAVNLNLFSSFYNILEDSILGTDYINQVILLINDQKQVIDIDATRNETLDIEVPVPQIPGIYSYELFCKGAKDSPDLPDEFSNSIYFEILITDFSIEGQTGFEVCGYDENYTLAGNELPGGVFRGDCVLESSNVFNPSLVSAGITEIFYDYTYQGTTYTTSHEITIYEVPEVEISTNHEVCGNDHGVVYRLSGEYSTVTWDIPEEIIHPDYFFPNTGEVKVNFKPEGSGRIVATAETEFGCTESTEFIVNIGFFKAPADSARVTLIDRVLFCDDTTVSYYDWYRKRGSANEYMGTTFEKPYFYLAQPPQAGDEYYVLTAFNTSGCNTNSRSYIVPSTKSGMGDKVTDYVYLYPNPTKGLINIGSSVSIDDLVLTVTDLPGREVLKKQITSLASYGTVELDLKPYGKGVYLLKIKTASDLRIEKIIVQ